jgi:hypothetical protein
VQGYYELPLLVNLSGRLDKVTILFKPLGLNHFINKPFNEVVGKPSRIFTEWDNSEYFTFLDAFYKTDDNKKRVLLLETFLQTIYKPLEKENLFQKALNQLTDFENDCSIQEIARNLSFNIRTFNRLFYKYLPETVGFGSNAAER